MPKDVHLAAARALRTAVRACTVVALVALAAPATASAGVLDVYQELAERQLHPAPLVPTTVPPSLAPLDRTIATSGNRRRLGYGLRMAADGPDAVIVLERGTFKTMRAALREARRLGFTARRTRVRGRPGRLLSRHLGPTQRLLVWIEDGLVHSLGTGTARTVSRKQLRATAAGLDRLGSAYLGAPDDPESSAEGWAVTTEHTVSVRVSWEAQCVAPGASVAEIRVGTAQAITLERTADAFSFDIAPHRVGTGAWSGAVAGTVSPAAIALTVQATGTIDGLACDTGSSSFRLRPLRP